MIVSAYSEKMCTGDRLRVPKQTADKSSYVVFFIFRLLRLCRFLKQYLKSAALWNVFLRS